MKPANFWSGRKLRLIAVVALVVPLVAFAQASAPAGSQQPPTREQVERRLASIGALVSQSSGAKQIESSSNVDAKIQLTKARDLHAQAKAMLDAGDLETTGKLLHAAQRTLVEAVGMALCPALGMVIDGAATWRAAERERESLRRPNHSRR